MKLKENITREQLESVGFVFYAEDEIVGLLHCRRLEKNGQEVYILLNKVCWEYNREIGWNSFLFKEPITPYIQDLIDLGWIEEIRKETK